MVSRSWPSSVQGARGHALLDAVDRKGVPEHAGRDRLGDPGAVGHTLHDPLDRPPAHADLVVLGKDVKKERGRGQVAAPEAAVARGRLSKPDPRRH